MMSCEFMLFVVFCFFKQKTAYEMRISDWSSDVCSSDLTDRGSLPLAGAARRSGGRVVGTRPERLHQGRPGPRRIQLHGWRCSTTHAGNRHRSEPVPAP